jgi:hypothetical protein
MYAIPPPNQRGTYVKTRITYALWNNRACFSVRDRMRRGYAPCNSIRLCHRSWRADSALPLRREPLPMFHREVALAGLEGASAHDGLTKVKPEPWCGEKTPRGRA